MPLSAISHPTSGQAPNVPAPSTTPNVTAKFPFPATRAQHAQPRLVVNASKSATKAVTTVPALEASAIAS